jgi:phenylacetic acid degradation operon negative regulatory protein
MTRRTARVESQAEESITGPQSILATMLGDYSWQLVRDAIPSSLFVALLGLFDIDAVSSRVALERVAKKGLLDRIKSGRNVYYRLSRAASERRLARVGAVMRFGLDFEPWDGTWTMVLTSVPEAQKELRAKLRAELADQGFTPYYAAVWIRANRSAVPAAQQVIRELGVEQGAVFNARYEPGSSPAADPITVFPLDDVEARYREFIGTFSSTKIKFRKLGGADALVLRTRLMDAWRNTIKLDPKLPAELLPPRFSRDKAREVFLETYDLLGPAAEEALLRVARASGLPEDVALRHFTSSEIIAGKIPMTLRPRS